MNGRANNQIKFGYVPNAKVLTGINPERKKPNMTGIYAIQNTVTGMRYIGQAVGIKRRFSKHFCDLRGDRHHCPHLQRSFKKYGESVFIRLVLEMCTKDDLTQREQYWMDFYRDSGIYNAAPLAGGSCLGVKHSADTIARRIASNKGKKRSQESRERIAAGMRGKKRGPRKPFSPETREKMAAAKRGKTLSPEHKDKIVASLIGNAHTLGHKLSDDHKEKIKTASTGRAKSAEERQKIADALRGHTVSQSTREKLSIAGIGRKHSDAAKVKIGLASKQRYEDGLVARQSNGNFVGIT
jgi:group I intron endonuclease